MEAARQRSLVRVAIASKKKKKKEEAFSSAPKDITKVPSKRKSQGKDDRPLKKGPVIQEGDKQKKLSLVKTKHGMGKGLMTGKGPITEANVHRLLTHKDHVVEVIESIIKDIEMDPCVE